MTAKIAGAVALLLLSPASALAIQEVTWEVGAKRHVDKPAPPGGCNCQFPIGCIETAAPSNTLELRAGLRVPADVGAPEMLIYDETGAPLHPGRSGASSIPSR